MLDIEISCWKGESKPFHLDDGEHTVGRADQNAVQISAPRVSNRHAVIRVDGERLFVRDLGSSNGTEVNGKPIGAEEVEVVDHSLVSFAGAMMRRVKAGALGLGMQTMMGGQNVTSKVRYNMKQGFSSEARDRMVSNSAELFELLSSGDDATEVATAACGYISRVVSADRVVLLEDQGEATQIEARARWVRSGDDDDDAPLQLSTTIVDTVISERDAVLVANAMEDPKFAAQQSIMQLSLCSAMAAPLFDNERVRGILYVDTVNPRVQYDTDDLAVLTAAANAVAVKLRNLSLESEMRTAGNIQQSMLPEIKESPPGFELDAYQVMCRACGGDLYHCLTRPDGKVLIALGDVSGKGMPAALAMTAAIVLIGMLAELGGDLEEMAGHIHRQLYKGLADEQFITLFLCELDADTGHMKYVNAGHEPGQLLRANGEFTELEATGLPIAMVEDAMLQSGEATMEPGDLLMLVTDGIPEATTDGDTFLGLEPVLEILKNNREAKTAEIRDLIMAAVDEFLGGEGGSDDVTLMLLRRDRA